MISRRLLNILVLISAAVSIYFDINNETQLYRILKPITTILVVLIPIFHGNKAYPKYLRLTIVALVFCLLGDVLLLEDSRFVFGLASFLIAHILFTISFVSLDKWKNNMPVLLGFLIFGVAYILFIYQNLGDLKIPVLAYVVFILIMGWQATSLYASQRKKAFRLMAIGACLFIFSDSMIALSKFKMAFEMSSLVILASYWVAILLLANAACLLNKNNSILNQTLT